MVTRREFAAAARVLQWNQRLRGDIETVVGRSFDGLSEAEIADQLEVYCIDLALAREEPSCGITRTRWPNLTPDLTPTPSEKLRESEGS